MKLKVFLLFIIAAFFITGCTPGVALEDLLQPPKLSDEQLELYTALMNSKSGGLTLKYPKSGEYRSAFVVEDFDDEPTEEAIVFYEAAGIGTEKTLWLGFLDRSESGDWESVYDLSIKGTDIERISFVTLGDDSGRNILINYSLNQTEKAFLLVRYNESVPYKLLEGSFSYMCVGEFFGMEENELLVIKNDYTLETSTVTFYKWNEGRIVSTGSCSLDPSAGEYLSITEGKLSDTVNALFINHRKYGNKDYYGTDVIYHYMGKPVNLVLQNSDNMEKVQRRSNTLSELANPRDINGDGYIEVCSSNSEFPGYNTLASADKLRPVIWRTLRYATFEELYYSYFSERNDFVFILPNRWKSNVTAVLSLDGRKVTFYEATQSVIDVEKELLTIATVNSGEEPPSGKGWELYERQSDKGLDYYIRTPKPDDPMTLTADEFAYGFKILSDIDNNALKTYTGIEGGVMR